MREKLAPPDTTTTHNVTPPAQRSPRRAPGSRMLRLVPSGWALRLAPVALLLAAVNLRPAVTSVGPVLEEARGGLGMSATLAGLLTSMPAACFALVGFTAPRLARRHGPDIVVALGMTAVAAGLALRPLAPNSGVFVALSALALAGIAVANVLLPVVVKQRFPDRVGAMTGLYAMALNLGASTAAAVTVPLAREFGGDWRVGLGAWSLLAAVAVPPWLALIRNHPRPIPQPTPYPTSPRAQAPTTSPDSIPTSPPVPASLAQDPAVPPDTSPAPPPDTSPAPPPDNGSASPPARDPAVLPAGSSPAQDPAVSPCTGSASPSSLGPASSPVRDLGVLPGAERGSGVRLVRSPTAWALAVYFGLQATAAYVVIGWLPQIFRDAGLSAETAGLLFAVTSVLGIPLSFALAAVAGRLRGQGGIAVVLGLFGLAGYAGLWGAPAAAPWLWACLIGIANCSFPLVLTMIGMRGRDGATVVRLSAFAQSTGYLLSIPGPILVGALYEHTGGWRLPLAFLTLLMLPQLVAGHFAGRDRQIG